MYMYLRAILPAEVLGGSFGFYHPLGREAILIMKSLNYCIACLAGVGLMGTPVNKLVRGPRKVRICNMGKRAKSRVESLKA
jgi:hypothetical protein